MADQVRLRGFDIVRYWTTDGTCNITRRRLSRETAIRFAIKLNRFWNRSDNEAVMLICDSDTHELIPIEEKP